MKKRLLLSMVAVSLFTFSASATFAAGCPLSDKSCPPVVEDGLSQPPLPPGMTTEKMEKMKQFHQKKKAEIDARLKLTEEQKKCCEQNRLEGRKLIKPIWDEIRAKKAKICEICSSTLPQAEKDKQVCCLKSEIKDLKCKADKIREENMKAFEAILTPQQKSEFEKIKQERKQKMEQRFKKHKGCHGHNHGGPCPPQGPCPLNK